ncbi:hypothetical protein JCM19038_2799 [Geomicrobium sp. JCM 19038]|nr:hypothetical protein JCM19038_2799 [Geomicrobium sp. JCM 19038]
MTLSEVVELGRYDSGDEYKNVMNAVNKAGLQSARSVFAISEGKRYAELKDRE